MPMEDLLVAWQASIQRIALPLGGQRHIKKADLGRGVALHRSLEEIGQYLPSQADPKIGEVPGYGFAQNAFLHSQIWIEVLAIHLLETAQANHGGIPAELREWLVDHLHDIIGNAILIQEITHIARRIFPCMLQEDD